MNRALLALPLALLPFAPPTRSGACVPSFAASALSFDAYHQGIFFAVLEGLYRDGVSTEVALAVLELDPQSRTSVSFVPGCPICTPAQDAFRLYAARPKFVSKPGTADTFGPGLSPEQVVQLTGGDPTARRQALRGQVEHWVSAWLDRMRLDPAERNEWERQLAARSEKGMAILDGMRRSDPERFAGFDECPFCAGAEAGSRSR